MFGVDTHFTSFKSSRPSVGRPMIGTGGSSGGGGLIGGIIGAIGGIIIAGLNYSLQKEQFKWQKKAWQQQMDREDNAMQRRVLDLQQAGLSRVLAAGGSGAGASGAPQIQAPKLELNLAEQAAMVMSLIQGQKNIAKTEAETQLIHKQRELTGANAYKQWHDNRINKESGSPSDPSVPGRILRDSTSMFNSWFEKMKGAGKYLYQREKKIWSPYYKKLKKKFK